MYTFVVRLLPRQGPCVSASVLLVREIGKGEEGLAWPSKAGSSAGVLWQSELLVVLAC